MALLLSLGLGGFVVAKETTRGYRTREDRKIIAQTITEFGDKVKADDITGAYTMFSERFHQNVALERFTSQMNFLRESELFGKLKGTDWNGLADFHVDDASGQRFAFTKLKMNLDKTQIDVEATLRKDGQRWIFENMPTFFPPQQQGPGQGQGQPRQ
jgi:hypothetical protein